MRHYDMTEAEVRLVLEQPDAVTPSRRGRSNAWKQTENGWRRVTYTEETGSWVVITVTPRRRGPEAN